MNSFINKVIKTLIANNVVLNLGWGLIVPLFAIFILQRVAVENVAQAAKIVGLSELIFYVTKSAAQIPIGRYLDKNHGEKDDFWFMVIGTFINAVIPIGYLFASQAWHIYVLQIVHGLATAMIFPSWAAMFTRHIDKNKEGVEWSLQSTSGNLAFGGAAALGGFALALFNFQLIFVFVSVFTFLSGILMFFIKEDISSGNEPVVRIPIQVYR